MPCRSCKSECVTGFDSEINIHLPGLRNLQRPGVWVFPKLIVCFNCGYAECRIDAAQVAQLREASAAA